VLLETEWGWRWSHFIEFYEPATNFQVGLQKCHSCRFIQTVQNHI